MSSRELPRVLIVDDDPNILRALTARLSFSGYAVSSARDAAAALASCEEMEPAVAILDINLPGIDGTELADRIDSLPQPHVGKVFLTASRDPALKRLTARFENAGYLEKPFSARELLEQVNRCIESSK